MADAALRFTFAIRAAKKTKKGWEGLALRMRSRRRPALHLCH